MNIQTFLKGATAPIALCVALAANPVLAQSSGPADDVAAATDEAENSQAVDNSIIVTGSRIRSKQYDFANPIVEIDEAAIQNAGVTNLTDFLTDFPALTGSYDSNDGSGANAGIGGVGLNLLDLRNLGTKRTLLLIDGRRHVASDPGSSAVDINSLPIDLIERIDILTGGASAIYGADAVSGVVNFITKRDFEGLNFRVQNGISGEMDNGAYLASVTAGTNFAGGRGNIAGSFEYGHEDGFLLSQRQAFGSSFRDFYDNPAEFGGDDPNVPDLVLFNDVRYYDSHPTGAIDTDFDFLPDFIGDGSPFDPGTYIGSAFNSGGSGTPVSTYSGEILPKIDRYVGNLLLSYELADNVRVFAEGKYARVDSTSFGQPTFDFFIGVPTDNPFIPANVEAVNDFDPLGIVLITGRDNFDLGRRGERNRRETYRGVVGLDADLTESITLNMSYVYGQSDSVVRQSNTRYNDRFYAALDAVDEGEFLTGTANGNIVCRSNLTGDATSSSQYVTGAFYFEDYPALSFTPGANSGCVPLNIFSGTQSQAAIDFVMTDAVDVSTIKQHVASMSIAGDFGENVALWGGPIGFAIGGEYRKEISRSFPDPVNTTGLTFGNALFPEVGSFDVNEVFGELRIPIAADMPGLHELTINGAARLSDYSTVGTTFTYQAGLIYAPIPDIRLRGTYAQTVRAPNIGELFAPQSQTFATINDPCAVDQLNNGSEFRAENCRLILSAAGLTQAQIDVFSGDSGSSLPGLVGGNINLTEETAKTITAGIILQPSFIPRLTLSADFYDVKIKGAIATPSATTVARLCVDAPTIDNFYCGLVEREPAGGLNPGDAGLISSFSLFPSNVAAFKTRGVDFSARYSVPTDKLGVFSMSLVGNYLDSLETTATPGGVPVESKGEVDSPEWQVNFDLNWTINNFQLTYGFNFFDETSRFSRATLAGDPDIVAPEYLMVDARFTHDAQVAVTVEESVTGYFGVNNMFNQKPDVGYYNYPVKAVGRFFYVGARASFGKILP